MGMEMACFMHVKKFQPSLNMVTLNEKDNWWWVLLTTKYALGILNYLIPAKPNISHITEQSNLATFLNSLIS